MTNSLKPEFYRTLFEEAPIGLALCRLDDGKLVDVNKAYADILGRTVAETLGLSYWQITPRKYERQEAEQLEAIKTEGRYGPYEKDYLHRENNRMVPVRLSGVVVEIDGVKYIWSHVEDLTEERYRTLFQSAHPPLALCETDGTILLVNKSFASLLSKTVAETVGLNFWRLTPRQNDAEDQERRQELAENGLFKDYSTHFCDRTRCFSVTVQGLRVPIRRKNYDLFCVEAYELGGPATGLTALDWEDQSCGDNADWRRPIRE